MAHKKAGGSSRNGRDSIGQRRGIKKWYGLQGRTDFMVANPDVMRRLRDIGVMMILSGYEGNSDNQLELLRKKNTVETNQKAAKMLPKYSSKF